MLRSSNTKPIMKQYEAVIQAIDTLGGIATLQQLNQEVFKIKECKWNTKTPFASIRRIVQQTKEIYKIKPGLYALESYRKDLEGKGIIVETEKNKDSEEIIKFNHSYYQGLLLSIGNLKGLKTFAPNQDKNKPFGNQKIDEIRTIHKLPIFSYNHYVQRCSTIDVIWFNERNMPDSFFEVEHSTDITNSLQKFNDLQDFHTKMYIVADIKRYNEFKKKLEYISFNLIRKDKRVKFLCYNDLEKQYTQIIAKQSVKTLII